MKFKVSYILFSILILAAIFRFANLGAADVIHDESINSFRALGYIDFFAEGQGQETTLKWFDNPPAWTKLSFHDHPPLSFILNGIFLNIYGPDAVATRLLSAFAGLASVFLIFRLGQKLFNTRVGVTAALILAVNAFFVWIARIGFQESLLIALALASLYYFILSLENKKLLLISCGFFGLAFLTKYTAVFLLPIYVVLFLWQKRDWVKDKYFYLGSIIFIILISPVIIFNSMLFKARGHFDLQLSYIFGLTDKVPGWNNLVGKSDLSVLERFISLPVEFTTYVSPAFLVIASLAILGLIVKFKHNKLGHGFVLLSLASLVLLVGAVGPQDRFLILFMPFLALAVAALFAQILNKKKIAIYIIFLVFIIFEGFYTVNTFFITNSFGTAPYTYSKYIKDIRGNWGFNQLDEYLNQELKGKSPAIRFQQVHPYLESFVVKNFEKNKGVEEPILLIYDFNIKGGPDIWYIQRRQFYQGWPLVTADIFIKELAEQGEDFYTNLGFEKFYFVQVTSNTLLRDVEKRSDAGKTLGDLLLQSGIKPIEINNLQGELSLLVYKF